MKKRFLRIALLALLSSLRQQDATGPKPEEFFAGLKRLVFNVALTIIFIVALYRFVLYEIRHLT